jgi:hypothetical protein
VPASSYTGTATNPFDRKSKDPKVDITFQIHAFASSRRLGRSTLRHRTRSPLVSTTTPSDLVFQHRSRRDSDGDRRIRVPHPVEPAEPLLCNLVRGSGMSVHLSSSPLDSFGLVKLTVTKQYFFIVVAPVFFSAAIYSLASVMITIYGREYAPMPPKLVLWVFIVCDVVATIVQIAGAALVGVAYSNQEDPTTPNNILLTGLAFQVFSFAIFLVVLFWTLIKARKSPASISRSFVIALVVATLAVYLRTCFRLAETAEGLLATLSTHEVYFGCLEFAPIVVAVYLLVYWHPGRCLPGSSPLRKPEREAGGVSDHF